MEKMINIYPLPNRAKVDFAMVCIGNDLRSSRIYDGDLVYFQKATRGDIREGDIVSVRYGDSAKMFKATYFSEGGINLGGDGCLSRDFIRDEDEDPILGRAIAFMGWIYHPEEGDYITEEGEDE